MDGSDDEEVEFTINEAYASKYNEWRGKEELQKLKDKYGDDVTLDQLENDESSSESEDEDAEELTPQLEKDWFRALSAIKSRDPKIYDKNVEFFIKAGEDEGTLKERKDKEKPMFLKDYERKVIVEKGGVLSDEDGAKPAAAGAGGAGYYEEQENIKKGFAAALQSDDEDDDDDLLVPRTKTTEEQETEEQDYIEWLKGQKTELETEKVGVELDPLKTYWQDPKLDDGEKFLRDYILNKKYLEQGDDRIPTYDEIVNDEDISEEEKELEKEAEFERKYNFRFEEPDTDFIKSYPRTIKDTVRRKDDKRAVKRKEVKDRKLQEKEKKQQELRELKNLKKKEIMDKISRIKEITGNDTVGFSERDLEEDFDPDKYDQQMKAMFDTEYYDAEDDIEKPVFTDDEDDMQVENWDKWAGPEEAGPEDTGNDVYGEEDGPYCEDPDFVMDADYDPSQAGPSTSKKKKKKSKFAQAVEKQKPVFDPDDKQFEEYFEEYYKLDYEDIIGDTPCRFKYRQVIANDFGLDTGEVLSAKEKELNQWVSVKKMSQYRTEEEEKFDIRYYKKRSKKKYNIITSLKESDGKEDAQAKHTGKKNKAPETITSSSQLQESSQDNLNSPNKNTESKTNNSSETKTNENPQTQPKRKRKKKKKKAGSQTTNVNTGSHVNKGFRVHAQISEVARTSGNIKSPAKNKNRKRKGKDNEISEERLKAYGLDPKRVKYGPIKKFDE